MLVSIVTLTQKESNNSSNHNTKMYRGRVLELEGGWENICPKLTMC